MLERTENLTNLSAELHAAISSFPVQMRQQALFGEWSLQDILAHLSGWANLTNDSFKKAQDKEPIPLLMEDSESEDFNRSKIQERKGLTWQEVYDEFIKTDQELLNSYASISSQSSDLETEFAEFCMEGDLEHYKDHLEAIKRLSETL